MSRNRKRAKERRARRPSGAAVGSPGLAAAREESAPSTRESGPAPLDGVPTPLERTSAPLDGVPTPLENVPASLEHAAPDVELADVQVALGRSELPDGVDLTAEAQLEEQLLEEEIEDQRSQRAAEALPAVAPHRASIFTRLVGFLQGSWRELQRVQWPDRRQVVQATGVVIGFVIVAGVFLALAGLAAQHLVTFILK